MCTPLLFTLLRQMAEPTPFLPPFFLLQKSLHSGGLQLPSPFWDSRGISDPHREDVFDGVISSDLLPLNDPDTPTLLHRLSPDISFAPSSLAFSCSWVVLQDLGSNPLLYQFFYPSLSLRSFSPTSVPLPSIFRKLAGMTMTLTVLLQRNTRLFFFPLLLLSVPLWH